LEVQELLVRYTERRVLNLADVPDGDMRVRAVQERGRLGAQRPACGVVTANRLCAISPVDSFES
jgi:hypothetical protein